MAALCALGLEYCLLHKLHEWWLEGEALFENMDRESILEELL
jgi:hypothetical protein